VLGHNDLVGSFCRPAPVHGGPELGDHGSPAGRFDRAIKSGSLFLAELAAREIGPLPLGLALELVALAAVKDPARAQRLAARWLERWLAETGSVTAADAAFAAAALAALGGPRHDVAHTTLRGLLRPSASSGRNP
jgi:hypothetical protein